MIRARALAPLVFRVSAALALVGCYRDFVIEPPPGRDAGRVVVPDSGPPPPPPDAGWREPTGICVEPTGVDLLLVIDDSASMAEEQASLAAEIPRMISALVDPPDDDGDGLPDWTAVADLRVAVITTDMGSAGFDVPTCGSGTFGAMFGDDAVLRTRGELAACASPRPPVFTFAAGDVGAADALACVATVGTSGCGFEQQLDATLKALAPSAPAPYTAPTYDPPRFFAGTLGHGDGANAGFVRDGSLLAVVIVTDEEDCSVRDPDLLNPISPRYGSTDLNLRCFTFPDALHPVERYVDGLVALRADRPDLLALGVIAGIPVETAVELPGPDDFDAILDHPDMVERIDPEMPTRLVPSCSVPGRGLAFAPRRLVRVAAGLGEGRSTVQSICQADFTPAVTPIVRMIARRACHAREIL